MNQFFNNCSSPEMTLTVAPGVQAEQATALVQDLTSQHSLYGGYCCSCGQWVTNGNSHVCNWVPQQQVYSWPTWTYAVTEQIKMFKGAIKTASDLPSDATIGDAYYVKDLDALFVRVTAGWLFHGKDD